MKYKLLILTLILGIGSSISLGQVLKQIEPKSEPFGIVDCFGQGKVYASHVRGQIVDPTGVPVSQAQVLLSVDGQNKFQAKSDKNGRFSLAAPAGTYVLKVQIEPFAGPELEIVVGRDISNLFRSQNVNVLLGLPGSFCPWVTTDRLKLRRAIDSNNRMLKELAEKHAT